MSKILVLNKSGNTGKSMVSREILNAGTGNVKLIEVENINEGSSTFKLNNYACYNVDDIDAVMSDLVLEEDVVVDVGASSLLVFLEKLSEFDGILDEIDFFVLPVVSDSKESKDSVETIAVLIDVFSIDESKIKVIFNKHTVPNSIEETYDEFFYLLQEKVEKGLKFDIKRIISEAFVVPKLSILNMMFSNRRTLNELFDGTDWKSKAQEAMTKNHKQKAEEFVAIHLMTLKAKVALKYRDYLVSCLVPKKEVRDGKESA